MVLMLVVEKVEKVYTLYILHTYQFVYTLHGICFHLCIFWIDSEQCLFRDPVFGGSPYPLQYGGCGVPGLQVRLPLDSLVQGENISSQLGENIFLIYPQRQGFISLSTPSSYFHLVSLIEC